MSKGIISFISHAFALGVIVTVVFFLLAGVLAAEAPSEEWNRTYGGGERDVAFSVQQTTDGGFILAGYTESYGASDRDAWLIKTDAKGVEEWNRTFGGEEIDAAYSVQETKDGGFILAGYTESYGAGDYDAWLIKTDAKGVEEWNRTYGGGDYDEAYFIQQTTDGGYVLACTKTVYRVPLSFKDDNTDAWLVKTDENGVEEWNRTFGEDVKDHGYSVQQTTDGGYVLAGDTRSYGIGSSSDAWLIKTDAKGVEEWNRTFGGGDYDVAYFIQQTTDGGYILAGDTRSYGVGRMNAWLIKTDSNGFEEWNRTWGQEVLNGARSVQETTDGGYIVVTTSWSSEPSEVGIFPVMKRGAYLIKIDPNGGEEWIKRFGGGEIFDDEFNAVENMIFIAAASTVQETSDGGYVFTASRLKGNYLEDGDDADAILVKIEGEERAMDAFTPGFEIFTGVASAALIAAVLVFRRKRE